MEPKPEPQEPQQTPEVKDNPEHAFVKDWLGRISFLNPKTQERTSLSDRLGKLWPKYESLVLTHFDYLKATEGPPAQYKEDAKRRAKMIYEDWKREQAKERGTDQSEKYFDPG